MHRSLIILKILSACTLYLYIRLQEHLLKMTSQHRAEMALKRGKPSLPEEGWLLVPSFSFMHTIISFKSFTFRG